MLPQVSAQRGNSTEDEEISKSLAEEANLTPIARLTVYSHMQFNSFGQLNRMGSLLGNKVLVPS